MNNLNIQITGWNDGFDYIRERIIRDILDIMYMFFKNDGLYESDLTICNITSVNCRYADDRPCTHPDRSKICINSSQRHWCQFVHQLSHELCHCSTSRCPLPLQIKWFDEFLCCCSSFLVEKYISTSTNEKYNYMFGNDTANAFGEYLKTELNGHIYKTDNVKNMFFRCRELYEKNQNLIKEHDVYVYEFFRRIGSNWHGLSFIGKMWKVNTDSCFSVEEFLSRLSLLCDSAEKEKLKTVVELFGLGADA